MSSPGTARAEPYPQARRYPAHPVRGRTGG